MFLFRLNKQFSTRIALSLAAGHALITLPALTGCGGGSSTDNPQPSPSPTSIRRGTMSGFVDGVAFQAEALSPARFDVPPAPGRPYMYIGVYIYEYGRQFIAGDWEWIVVGFAEPTSVPVTIDLTDDESFGTRITHKNFANDIFTAGAGEDGGVGTVTVTEYIPFANGVNGRIVGSFSGRLVHKDTGEVRVVSGTFDYEVAEREPPSN